MDRETPAGVFARHEACGGHRAGLGHRLRAVRRPRYASRTDSRERPGGPRWKAFNASLRAAAGPAGGQGKLTGLIFRVGHLGSVTLGEILDAIGVLEETSLEHGRSVEIGAAVAAAQRAALESTGALAPVEA